MKNHLWLVTVFFLLSCYFLYLLLINVDPFSENQSLVLALFFLVSFIVLSLFFCLLLFFGTELLYQKKFGDSVFLMSLRRGIFLGVVLIIALALKLFNLFGVLEFGIVIAFFVLLELIFVQTKKKVD